MESRKINKIGIFEYDWSMYGFIKDFAIKLAEAGYSIDIFYKDMDMRHVFADTGQFLKYYNIRYFNYTTQPTITQKLIRKIKRLINILAIFLYKKRRERPENTIDPEIMRKSEQIVEESQYLCFIGVEKKGLIWAGILSQKYKCPFIYYSLELYIEDHPEINRYYHIRDAEKKYHQLTSATIIQDNLRANALLNSNGVENTNVLYLPISVRGDIVQDKSKFLHHKFNIDENKKILLYFGAIYEERFTTQIVRMAKDLDDDVVLILHGVGPKKYLDYLQSIADKTKVIFSLDFVTENDIIKIISSAAIGIALYKTTNSNERLIAHSSVKLAYYTQCGVPVIAFDTDSSADLMNSYKCGELINMVNEIPQKVHQILGDYASYKKQAFLAFNHFYDLDNTFAKFLSQFEEAIKKV